MISRFVMPLDKHLIAFYVKKRWDCVVVLISENHTLIKLNAIEKQQTGCSLSNLITLHAA